MSENPHDKEDLKRKAEKLSEESKKDGEKSSQNKDRTEKSYYYDDAHGYEIYTDEDEEES